MFIRIKAVHNRSKVKKYYYVYLVKSIWDKEKKQSRQKVIKYIGKAEGLEPIIVKEIFERDNYTCQKCSCKDNLTIDHKIPLSKGGTNDKENLQVYCLRCNQKKRNLI